MKLIFLIFRSILIFSTFYGLVFFSPPIQVNLENSFLPAFSGMDHPFGTDRLGRDIYSLYSYGIFTAFLFAIPARILTIILSGILVFLAYYGGPVISFFMDSISSVFISLPSLLVALVSVYFFGTGPAILIFCIVLSDWASVYESVRARVQEVSENGYVIASHSFGAGKFYLFRNHILPDLVSILRVLFTTGVPSVIMTISIFSYLGIEFGSDQFGPGLGEQISFSKDFFDKNPSSLITPIVGIFLLVFSFSADKLGHYTDEQKAG